MHLADSTYKQAVGIKENTLVYIKGCPALIDFVIVDMPEDTVAPTILGRPFLRTIKALINLHEGNMKLSGIPLKQLLENHCVFVHCIIMTACSCHHATLHLSIVIIMHIVCLKTISQKAYLYFLNTPLYFKCKTPVVPDILFGLNFFW